MLVYIFVATLTILGTVDLLVVDIGGLRNMWEAGLHSLEFVL